MTENKEKYLEYAALITSSIGNMFEEGSDYYIDNKEFAEGDNLTHFLHALANVVPTHIFNDITGDNKNQLEFNHTANHLCFQYGKIEE